MLMVRALLISIAAFLGLVAVAGLLLGCATVNLVEEREGVTVLWTDPPQIQKLCRNTQARACYMPGPRLVVVSHGDNEALAHELLHARCYRQTGPDCVGHFHAEGR